MRRSLSVTHKDNGQAAADAAAASTDSTSATGESTSTTSKRSSSSKGIKRLSRAVSLQTAALLSAVTGSGSNTDLAGSASASTLSSTGSGTPVHNTDDDYDTLTIDDDGTFDDNDNDNEDDDDDDGSSSVSRVRRGFHKVKATVKVSLMRIENLPSKLSAGSMYIEWRRGSKSKNKGKCESFAFESSTQSTAQIDQDLPPLTCTFYQAHHANQFEEKNILFTLKMRKSNKKVASLKSSSIAKATLNLADFASNRTDATTTVALRGKSFSATLLLRIATTWDGTDAARSNTAAAATKSASSSDVWDSNGNNTAADTSDVAPSSSSKRNSRRSSSKLNRVDSEAKDMAGPPAEPAADASVKEWDLYLYIKKLEKAESERCRELHEYQERAQLSASRAEELEKRTQAQSSRIHELEAVLAESRASSRQLMDDYTQRIAKREAEFETTLQQQVEMSPSRQILDDGRSVADVLQEITALRQRLAESNVAHQTHTDMLLKQIQEMRNVEHADDSTLGADNRQLQQQLASLQQELLSVSTAKQQLEHDIQQLQSRLRDSEQQCTLAASQADQLRAESNARLEQLSTATATIAGLQQSIQERDAQLVTVRSALEERSDQLDTARSELQQSTQQLMSVRATLVELYKQQPPLSSNPLPDDLPPQIEHTQPIASDIVPPPSSSSSSSSPSPPSPPSDDCSPPPLPSTPPPIDTDTSSLALDSAATVADTLPPAQQQPKPAPSSTTTDGPRLATAVAVFDYQATADNQLSFKAGDVIEIEQKLAGGWWVGSLNGKSGLYPANYTRLLANASTEIRLKTAARGSRIYSLQQTSGLFSRLEGSTSPPATEATADADATSMTQQEAAETPSTNGKPDEPKSSSDSSGRSTSTPAPTTTTTNSTNVKSTKPAGGKIHALQGLLGGALVRGLQPRAGSSSKVVASPSRAEPVVDDARASTTLSEAAASSSSEAAASNASTEQQQQQQQQQQHVSNVDAEHADKHDVHKAPALVHLGKTRPLGPAGRRGLSRAPLASQACATNDTKLESVQRELQQATQQRSEALCQIDQLKSELASQLQLCQQLQEQLQSTRTELSQQCDKNRDAEAARSDVPEQDDTKHLESQRAAEEAQLRAHALDQQLKAALEQIQHQTTASMDQARDLHAKAQELSDLQQQLQQASSSLEQATGMLDNVKQELQATKGELAAVRQQDDETVHQLREQLGQATRQVETLTALLASANAELGAEQELESQSQQQRHEVSIQARQQLEQATIKVDELSGLLDSAKQELESSKQELEAARHERDETRKQLQQVTSKVDELSGLLGSAKQELESTNQELEAARQQLDVERSAKQELESQSQHQRDEVSTQVRQQLEQATSKIDELSGLLRSANQELEASRRERQEMREQLEQATSKADVLTGLLQGAKQEHESTNQELEATRHECEETREQLGQATSKIDEIAGLLDIAKQELDVAQQQLESERLSKQELETQGQHQRDEVATQLAEQLGQATQQLQEAKSELESTRQQQAARIAELEQQRADENTRSHVRDNESAQRLQEVQRLLNDEWSKVTDLQARLDAVGLEREQAQALAAQLQTQIDALTRQLEQLEQQQQQASSDKIQELEVQLQGEQELRAVWQAQCTAANSRIEELQQAHDKLSRQLESTTTQLNTLQHDATAASERYELQVSTLKRQYEEQRAVVALEHEKRTTAEEQLQESRSAIEELQHSYVATQRECIRAQQQLEQLQNSSANSSINVEQQRSEKLIKKLQMELAAANSKLVRLDTGDHRAEASLLGAARATIESLTTELQKSEERCKKLESQGSRESQIHAHTHTQLTMQHAQQLAEKERELERRQANITKLERTVAAAEAALKTAQDSIEILRSEQQKRDTQIAQLTTIISEQRQEFERLLDNKENEIQDLRHDNEHLEQSVAMSVRRAEEAERIMSELRSKVDSQIKRIEAERQQMQATISEAKRTVEHEQQKAKRIEDNFHRRAHEIDEAQAQAAKARHALENANLVESQIYLAPLTDQSFLHTMGVMTHKASSGDWNVLDDMLGAIRKTVQNSKTNRRLLMHWFGAVAHVLQSVQKSDQVATVASLAVEGLPIAPLPVTLLLPMALLGSAEAPHSTPSVTGVEKSLYDLLITIFSLLYECLTQVCLMVERV
jgi:chromosome segregation ATPase